MVKDGAPPVRALEPARERVAMKYVLIVAALIAARVFLYPWLRRLMAKKFLRDDARSALKSAGMRAVGGLPERIVLVHQNLHSWRPDAVVAKLADPLFSKGFQEAGLYSIREMPGVQVRFMVKTAECLVAAICMHPRAIWLDLVTYYQNGNTSTFSTNAPHGLKPRPDHPTVHVPGATPVQLYTKTIAERPKGVFRPVGAARGAGSGERGRWARAGRRPRAPRGLRARCGRRRAGTSPP